jgi:hypothetical protein
MERKRKPHTICKMYVNPVERWKAYEETKKGRKTKDEPTISHLPHAFYGVRGLLHK